jgi:hypothetical protein
MESEEKTCLVYCIDGDLSIFSGNATDHVTLILTRTDRLDQEGYSRKPTCKQFNAFDGQVQGWSTHISMSSGTTPFASFDSATRVMSEGGIWTVGDVVTTEASCALGFGVVEEIRPILLLTGLLEVEGMLEALADVDLETSAS